MSKMCANLEFETVYLQGFDTEDGVPVSDVGSFAEALAQAMVLEVEPIFPRIATVLEAGIAAHGSLHEAVGGGYPMGDFAYGFAGED